jgi:hypothetical protein
MGMMEGSLILLTTCFRKGEPRLTWEFEDYVGPDVNTLPQEVTEVVDHLLKQVGLSTEMLTNMVKYTSIEAD